MSEYPVILGQTNDGKAVCLLGCFDLRLESKQGFKERTIHADVVVVGAHLDGPSLPCVRSVNARLQVLKKWLGKENLKFKPTRGLKEFHMEYERDQPIKLSICGEFLTIGQWIQSMPFGIDSNGHFAFEEKTYLDIQFDSPVSLEGAMSRLFVWMHFFTVICQDYCLPNEVEIETDEVVEVKSDITVYKRAKVFRQHAYSPVKRKYHHVTDMLVPYLQIKSDLANIMECWTNAYENLESCLHLYFATFYGGGGFLESEFINMAQSLEAFHRRFRHGCYMDEDEYRNKVYGHLTSLIPRGIEKDFRQSLKSRLKYAAEKSQRSRIKELVNENAKIIGLTKKASIVASDIVDYRNGFIHHAEKRKLGQKDIEKTSALLEFMRGLLELSMLRELGIGDEVFSGITMKTRTMRRRLGPKSRYN